MRRAWGNAADQMLLHIKEYGPCTASEILACVEVSPNSARRILYRLSQPSLNGPSKGKQRIHIKGWIRDAEGMRDYPRAVWAYGHGSNAAKPPPKTHTDVQRDCRNRMRGRVSSVFNMGVMR